MMPFCLFVLLPPLFLHYLLPWWWLTLPACSREHWLLPTMHYRSVTCWPVTNCIGDTYLILWWSPAVVVFLSPLLLYRRAVADTEEGNFWGCYLRLFDIYIFIRYEPDYCTILFGIVIYYRWKATIVPAIRYISSMTPLYRLMIHRVPFLYMFRTLLPFVYHCSMMLLCKLWYDDDILWLGGVWCPL